MAGKWELVAVRFPKATNVLNNTQPTIHWQGSSFEQAENLLARSLARGWLLHRNTHDDLWLCSAARK